MAPEKRPERPEIEQIPSLITGELEDAAADLHIRMQEMKLSS